MATRLRLSSTAEIKQGGARHRTRRRHGGAALAYAVLRGATIGYPEQTRATPLNIGLQDNLPYSAGSSRDAYFVVGTVSGIH